MYYPSLRWKQGEIKALENAPDDWSRKVCPIWIIENPNVGLNDAILGMISLWEGEQLLDMSRVEIDDIQDDLLVAIESSSLPFVIDPHVISVLNEDLKNEFDKRPCFRIECDSILDFLKAELHDKYIQSISSYLKSPNLKVILDFGFISQDYIYRVSEFSRIVQMYKSAGIEDLIILGGCFPKTLQEIQGVERIKRLDKSFYDALSKEIKGSIKYSDYATLSPDWSQSEIMRSNHINIRYTHDEYWVVLRQRGKDAQAIYELTQLLELQDEFRGPEFSWADNIWYLRSKTPPEAKPGNTTFHVSEFMHHHIAQVLAYG